MVRKKRFPEILNGVKENFRAKHGEGLLYKHREL